MKFVQLWALLVLAGGILGCGQKGPLVMPDAQKHKRTVPTLPGAPAKPSSTSPTPPAPSTPPAPNTAPTPGPGPVSAPSTAPADPHL